MKLVLGAILFFTFLGCQSNQSLKKEFKRNPASSSAWKTFIRNVAQAGKMTDEAVEKHFIEFIKRQNKDSLDNAAQMGLTAEQAQSIKTLSDDLNFLPKVRKWGLENMDVVFPNLQKSVFADAYKAASAGNPGMKNRYLMTSSIKGKRVPRGGASPFQSANQRKHRALLENIEGVNGQKTRDMLIENLEAVTNNSKRSPAAVANVHEIIESAAMVSKRTGVSGMGDGCEQFIKNASDEVLEIKANVDLYRAQLIEERAFERAGRSFANVDKDKIPSNLRLQQEDLDQATIDSFKKVLGYSDEEARAAVARLQKKPCRLY